MDHYAVAVVKDKTVSRHVLQKISWMCFPMPCVDGTDVLLIDSSKQSNNRGFNFHGCLSTAKAAKISPLSNNTCYIVVDTTMTVTPLIQCCQYSGDFPGFLCSLYKILQTMQYQRQRTDITWQTVQHNMTATSLENLEA